MKFKEWMNKEKLIIGSIVLGVFCIGTGGMLYTTKLDRKHQESSVSQVNLPSSYEEQTNAQPLTSKEDNDQAATNEGSNNANKEVDLTQTQVILEGEKPLQTTISMEQAAMEGLKRLSDMTDERFEGCKVYMSYLELSDTTKAGIWQGRVDTSETQRFTFEVSDPSGVVSQRKAYYKEADSEAWHSKTTDGTIMQIIDEKSLPAFENIAIDIEGQMSIDILIGNQYALYAEWEEETYEVSYEIKNKTLYIKDKDNHLFDSNSNNGNFNHLILYVPEDVTMKEVEVTNNTGYTRMGLINSKQINVTSNTGEIELGSVMAEDLELKNNTGNSSLRDVYANQVNLTSNTGAVELEGGDITILKATDINTGSVTLNGSEMREAEINVQTGSINITDVNSKQMDLQTQTGAITIEKTQCEEMNIEVQIGSIDLGKGLKGEITACTQLGEIYVQEKENNDCTYHLSTGLGEIS